MLDDASEKRLHSKRSILLSWTQIIANIAIVSALFFTALTLLFQYQQRKTDAAHELERLFNSEEIYKSKITLLRTWSDYDLSVLENNSLPESVVHAIVERITRSTQNPNETFSVTQSIVNISSFLDSTEACVESGRCNADDIGSRFGKYAKNFYCLYKREIERLRAQFLFADLGLQTRKLVERIGGCFV